MKKFIKYFVRLLLILVVVFFMTGLVVPKTNYQVTVFINSPLDSVFKIFNDKSKIKEWVPNVKVFEPIKEVDGNVGNSYKMIVDDKGKVFEITETIVAFEKNKLVTLDFNAQGMRKIDHFTFDFKNGVTQITNNATCIGTNYFFKCMFPYIKEMFKGIDQKYLDNFKALAEK